MSNQPDSPATTPQAPAPAGLAKHLRTIVLVIAAMLSMHSIFIAYYGQYVDPELIRSTMLFLCALVVMGTTPLASSIATDQRWLRLFAWCFDLALLANLAYACLNFLAKIEDIENLVVEFSALDQWSAFIAILSLIEFTRRTFGSVLALVGLMCLLYCLFGQDLPWFFRHSGFSLELTMEIIWFGLQGVFGFPTGIVVLLVFIFIVFGALLEGTGAGEVMIRMALAFTSRTRGGPAHSAIIASSLFGMSSGSVTANVVGTGAVTIPLIKRRGFPGSFAGGVEAAASTGGQLMPPVMGAAAFLMTNLAGVSYQVICIAALLPALLYYGSLFLATSQEAKRLGLKPFAPEERPRMQPGDGLKSLMFFLPLVAIISTLAFGRSPSMAGFWATITTIIVALMLNPDLRRNPKRIFAALAKGGVAGSQIMMAVGTIGVMIGVFELTGLGLKFATQVALLGDQTLFIALLLSAASCLVLGMGMPTLPAYLIVVLVLGTAMEKLGIPKLSVHLFVFYFGVLSAITPPVALAAVAAAPIAGAEPVRTGITALRLSLVGFVVPFVFIYEPSILLVVSDYTWGEFGWVMLRLLISIYLLTTGLSGYGAQKLGALWRLARVAAGLLMLVTIPQIQIPAFAVGLLVIAIEIRQSRRSAKQAL